MGKWKEIFYKLYNIHFIFLKLTTQSNMFRNGLAEMQRGTKSECSIWREKEYWIFYVFYKCKEIKSSNFQHIANAGFHLPLPQVHDCQNQQLHHHCTQSEILYSQWTNWKFRKLVYFYLSFFVYVNNLHNFELFRYGKQH